MTSISTLRRKYKALSRVLGERGRRLWAASEALELGWGGVSKMSEATGLARNTIAAGVEELEQRGPGRPSDAKKMRTRREGGGRKSLEDMDSGVISALEKLVDPTSRGDPMSPLRWTCKSTRNLAEELQRSGHEISHASVGGYLEQLGYSLQGNRKVKEGASHPDRNAQFEYIQAQVKKFQLRGQPVISVDAKKKELIGDFKNGGKEWRRKGQPEKVQTHDFGYADLGKGLPYGVYDLTANAGWVSVGLDHDTAEFAVETIKRWWLNMGRKAYAKTKELLVTADAGGSNASRSKLWKVSIQKFANETGIKVSLAHFPPGTSKWNKIEHRMFSFITQNWRGRPLLSHQVMVNLIGNTTTKTGLRIKSRLDNGNYETGKKISAQDLALVSLEPHAFRGEWNYTISPKKT